MRIAETHFEGYYVRVAVTAAGVQIRVEDPSGENATYEHIIGGAPVLVTAIVDQIRTTVAGFQSAKRRIDANWAEVERTVEAIGGDWTLSTRPSL